jgi:hypothetical protein
MVGSTSKKRVALVTPSYAADFERCKLLCESVDRFVSDEVDHYILVDNGDYAQFSELTGRKRHVVNELDILPSWLHCFRQGFSKTSRKVWLSTKTWPMRGWHVQQLRRIAIANFIAHEAILYCDSDMLFVRPFETQNLWRDESLRLYRKPNAINSNDLEDTALHFDWTRSAASLNGLNEPNFPAHDYINNLVTWRRQHVLDMCANIENSTGTDWVSAIGRNRSFSECQIYGAYVDGVLEVPDHWYATEGLCQTYWSGEALTRKDVEAFVDKMSDNQVAIGIQSFTNTEPDVLRYLLAA